jgi:hypothetical protein
MTKNPFLAVLLITLFIILVSAVIFFRISNHSISPSAFPSSPGTPMVGSDRDEHGCIGSAGYTWCPAKSKCLRVWEEKCQ